ncbi:hypothetical protein E4U52_007755, partial [Claviceps spartinae]
MATLSTSAHPRDTDGAAQISSDSEPSTPTNLQRTERAAHTAPERVQHPGKVAGEDTIAQTFLGKHLDDLNRSFQVKKEVFTKLGRTLDDLVTGYRGNNQREHRATARHLVSMVLEHLNTK